MSRLAQGVASKGHDVFYLCSKVPGRPEKEENSGIQILRMGNRTSLAAHAFHYYNKYLKGNVDIVIEEVTGGVHVPFLASRYVREPIVGVWYQRNTAIYMHQFPRPISWFVRLLDDFLSQIHRHDLIIVLSRDRAEDMERFGFSTVKLRIIPPGFQFGKAKNSPTLLASSNPREPIFVFLNKIRRYKCVHHAIYAFKHVADEYPDSRLIIAGKRDDIRYEMWLRRLVRRLGLETQIEFKINIPDGEIGRLLGNARALVLPSPIEGFSQVCLWANSQGTPAIVSAGVPRDTVRHMYNGIVVPFGDTSAYAMAMTRIIDDTQLFTSLSANSKEMVKNFDWEESVEKLLAAISELENR